jgi:HK97 family phage prohead protease
MNTTQLRAAKAALTGKHLEATFTMRCEADVAARTLTGTLVPYEVVGYTSWGPTVFAAGSLDIPDRVVLVKGHDEEQPAGLLASHDDNAQRLYGSFKVAATSLGDQLLLEASEGIRTGFSVGVQVDAYEIDEENDWIRVTRASLQHVGHVTFPAFADAQVDKVAASRTTNKEKKIMDEDEVNALITAALDKDKLEAAQAAGGTPPPADIPGPGGGARVQDPFPYRPGVDASFFRDMLNASHDPDARERFATATTMMTAAAETSDVSEIIPTTYRPDLYVPQLNVPTPVIDAFSQFTIDAPNPFRIPKFGSAAGLVSNHTEGTNPAVAADDAIGFDEQVVTPTARSGRYRCSREMVEGSNPAVDAIIMAAIREEASAEAETYAATTFLAGATSGTAIDDDLAPTGQVRQRMITFNTNRKRASEVFLAGADLFSALALEVDGAGRPMNPEMGPTNAAGSVEAGMEALSVSGRRTPLASAISTGGLLGVRTDAATFRSGMRLWRWEEKDGPANIEFAAFFYIVCAVIRSAGLLKFAGPVVD